MGLDYFHNHPLAIIIPHFDKKSSKLKLKAILMIVIGSKKVTNLYPKEKYKRNNQEINSRLLC